MGIEIASSHLPDIYDKVSEFDKNIKILYFSVLEVDLEVVL